MTRHATTLWNRESHQQRRYETRGTTTYESILKSEVYWTAARPRTSRTPRTPRRRRRRSRAPHRTPPHTTAHHRTQRRPAAVHALCWMLRKVNSVAHRHFAFQPLASRIVHLRVKYKYNNINTIIHVNYLLCVICIKIIYKSSKFIFVEATLKNFLSRLYIFYLSILKLNNRKILFSLLLYKQ